MLLEGQEDREKRFKAMLQYLILRKVFEFDDKFSVDSGAGVKDGSEVQRKEEEDKFKKESAEKILREMELKFYDLFVKDDLSGNPYLFLQEASKRNDNSKAKSNEDIFGILESMLCFKEKVPLHCLDSKEDFKDTIINLISYRKAIDGAKQNNKELFKKIFQSPKIENLIMTCDLASESGNSLISDIDKAFKSNNLASINDNNLGKINSQEESFNTIQAHIKTVTALSFGFLNLTGKFIAKTLGLETDSKSEGENSPVTPNKSVRDSKISEILESLNTDTHDYI